VIGGTLIFLIFRAFATFGVNTLQAVVINYIVCVITGVIYEADARIFTGIKATESWVWLSLLLGFLFISSFYLTAFATQRLGISVVSVASKMSLVFPVVFSLFIWKIRLEDMNIFTYTGITLAFPAVVLSSLKDFTHKSYAGWRGLFLAMILFLVGGLVDTMINYTNYRFISHSNSRAFPIIIFAAAGSFGILTLLVKGKRILWKSIAGGMILGIINYFSLILVLKTLKIFHDNGALFFPLFNIGIILFSTFLSILIFREKLKKINWAGLILAVLALLLISYNEITA
jgi:drug/metabolite transporter (DMT)-like permease